MSNPLFDPMMQSIASTLAGNAATALTEAGKTALAKIRDLLTRKSAEDPDTATRWAAAEDRDPEHPKVRELAEHLERLAAADPEFGRELRGHGDVLAREITTTNANSNHVSGSATKFVQGQNFGDITVN